MEAYIYTYVNKVTKKPTLVLEASTLVLVTMILT